MAGGVVRVAHVMHGLMMGGLEQVVIRLCEAGRAFGVEPHVIAFGVDGPVRGQLADRKIPLTYLGEVRGLAPRTLLGIGQVLRCQKIDVVHAHDLGPWLNALGGRALAPGVKTVATFHQISTPTGAMRVAATGAALLSDALVACGDEVLSCVRGWAPSAARIELIGNGVPLGTGPSPELRQQARSALGLTADAKVIGYLGRLHHEKGVDLLVDAFMRDLAQRDDVHLVLIGKGALEGELRARANGHPRIHFLGERMDGASLLAAMDVYVQPSRREGRSLAMLEAMAAGLPTVAQALPAMREIHVQEETALLVPPGERPELGAAMARLIEDAGLRERMGWSARSHVQRFSVTAMVQQYASLYRELLGASEPHTVIGAAR